LSQVSSSDDAAVFRAQTILVVDDMADIRQMLVALLGAAGYNVITAASVPEALTLTESATPDLMLIDIRVGDYNGLQVAVRERARGHAVPLIVMSGHHDPVLVKDAERLGAVFLLKPFDPDALLERINLLLTEGHK
jgi:DNA-binding response OmpR family regulator